jgi:lipoyl(octanoyl) transferase
VSTNLDYFKLIVPCGIADKPVTSLAQEMERSQLSRERKVPELEELAQQVARNFGRVFAAQTLWLESLDALLASSPPGPTNEDTPAHPPEQLRKLAGDEDIHQA